MRYLIKTCMLLAFSSVLMAQQSDIAKIDSAFFNSHARIITREAVQRLPFRGESQDYYALFPGTVQQAYRGTEFLHIRGSRHDEIAYSFEGVDVRSAFTGLNMIRFIPEALDRITLNTSPSASENSAVALLQHRLQRGGSDFRVSLKTETDRFTSNFNERLGTFSYGYFNLLLTAEGKILKDNIRFFAAGERSSFDDHYRKFWDGFRLAEPDFSFQDNIGQTLQEFVGTDKLLVRPGNIPNASSAQYTLNSLVTADYSRLQLRLVSALNWSKEQQNNTPILNIFDQERIPVQKQSAGFISLQADYSWRHDWQGHLQLDYLRSNEKTFDPVFKNNFFLYLDSLGTVDRGFGYGTGTFRIHSFLFNLPDALLAKYSKFEENYRDVSGAMQKKFGNHQFKLGGAFQRRVLRRFAIGGRSFFVRTFEQLNIPPDQLSEEQLLQIRNSEDIHAFGYDVFGNKITKADAVNDAPRHPTKTIFYLEDQFTSKDLLINLGLHYAGFSSGAKVFNDPNSPHLDTRGGFSSTNIPLASLKSATSHRFVLPRFAAQFNSNGKFSVQFQFGKYIQQPRLRDVYASRSYLTKILEGASFISDPRGTTAKPVRSTQTEFSVGYKISPRFQVTSTLFYKTTDGYLETEKIFTDPQSPAGNYNVLINSGATIAKGLELGLDYRNKGLYSWVSYSLSDVKGFTSYPITNLFDAEFSSSNQAFHSKAEPARPLEFNQKHRGNVLISYKLSRNASPFFRNTGLHLLFRFNNGHNFNLYDGSFG